MEEPKWQPWVKWEELAKEGDLEAQHRLALSIWEGWSTPYPDPERSIELWRKGADAGHVKSMFKLWRSERILPAFMVEGDRKASIKEIASKLEAEIEGKGKKADAETVQFLSEILLDKSSGEYDAVRGRKLRKQARQLYTATLEKRKGQDAEICYHLGMLYSESECVTHGDFDGNNELSFQFLKMGAEMGCPPALFRVSESYVTGTGVSTNLALGYTWAVKAAKTGFYLGYDRLAYHYYTGMGVQKNYLKVFKLLKLLRALGAEAFGNGNSLTYVLAIISYNGGYGVIKNFKFALRHLALSTSVMPQLVAIEKASGESNNDLKNPFGMMGEIFFMGGHGVKRSVKEAVTSWQEGEKQEARMGEMGDGHRVGRYIAAIECADVLYSTPEEQQNARREGIASMKKYKSLSDFADFAEAYLYARDLHSQRESRDAIINRLLKWKDSHHADQFAVYLADRELKDLFLKQDPVSFYYGLGVERDFKKAEEAFLARADSDDPFILFKLGCLYYVGGYGLEKNGKAAVKWFKKGARKGDRRCQFGLNMCYVNGVGCTALPTQQGLQQMVQLIQEGGPTGFGDTAELGLPHETVQEKADLAFVRGFVQVWGFVRVRPDLVPERMGTAVEVLTETIEGPGATDPFWHFLAVTELQRLGQYVELEEGENKELFDHVVETILKLEKEEPMKTEQQQKERKALKSEGEEKGSGEKEEAEQKGAEEGEEQGEKEGEVEASKREDEKKEEEEGGEKENA
uniref:Uncharacterized protein n=1 Tax=Palpitomonas bilix TaxID=652834 RepID=A0A7S3GMP0_9EUKA